MDGRIANEEATKNGAENGLEATLIGARKKRLDSRLVALQKANADARSLR